MYLSEAKDGDRVRIVDVLRGGHGGCGRGHGGCGGGGGKGIISRLAGMGIGIGQIVEVVKNEGRGPVIVKVGESKVAIGRGMASKIVVEKV